MNKIRKTIAILLAVLFLVTVTAGAASAAGKAGVVAYSATSNKITQELGEENGPIKKQGSDDNYQTTIMTTYLHKEAWGRL